MRKRIVFLSALLAPLIHAAESPLSNEKILEAVTLPAGYAATIFARPPDVVSPTAVCAAPDGTVFVAIDENGSIDRQPGRGRVVRCRDADGDGVAEEFTVVAKVDSPRGVIWDGPRGAGPGTLYVMHPPTLSAYSDADGDGTFESQRTLVEGLGYDLSFRGADHTTNGCRLGIDGWIYIAVGDYGFVSAKGRDGGPLEMKGGGIVRVRPDGTGLELVSIGQRNIYDIAVSPTLDLFTRDNTNDGGGWNVRLSYVPAGAHLGYPMFYKNFPEDMLQPLADFGGGSPTGALWIDEPGMPNGLYTVEWGAEAVMQHAIVADGAGWRMAPRGGADTASGGESVEQKKWLSLPRPTDIDVDATGRLYISSWAGGKYTFTPNVGYILRVAEAGAEGAAAALDVAAASDERLVAEVGCASATRRLAAQRELLRRGDRSGIADKLVELAKAAGTPASRCAAVETLKLLRGAKAIPALVNLTHETSLREHAVRALGDDARWRSDVPGEPLRAALRDSDPRVRREAITAARRLHKTSLASAMLPQVATDDPVLPHLAVRALRMLKATDLCLEALNATDPRIVRGALRVLYGLHDQNVVEGLIARLETRDGELKRGITNALCRLLYKEAPYRSGTWWGTRPDTSGPVFEGEPWEGSERIQAVLAGEFAKAGAEHARWLVAKFVRTKVEFPGFSETILRRAGDDPAEQLNAIESLVRRDHSMPDEALQRLRAIATDAKIAVPARVRALRMLQANIEHPVVMLAAMAALSGLSESEAAKEPFLGLWEEFTRDVKHLEHLAAHTRKVAEGNAREREIALAVLVNMSTSRIGRRAALTQAKRAVDTLWKNEERLPELLAAVARTRATTYAEQVRACLANSNPAIASAAANAARSLGLDDPNTTGATVGSLPYATAVAQVLAAQGNAEKGREIFLRAACIACHTVDANEPPKGPPLWGIAARYNRAQLLESILKPNATIAQGFESQWFTLSDARQVTGFVTRESGDSVDVRDIGGQATTIAKADIKERGKHEVSMMPAGLVDGLTSGELASLLAYLESLRGP